MYLLDDSKFMQVDHEISHYRWLPTVLSLWGDSCSRVIRTPHSSPLFIYPYSLLHALSSALLTHVLPQCWCQLSALAPQLFSAVSSTSPPYLDVFSSHQSIHLSRCVKKKSTQKSSLKAHILANVLYYAESII